MYILIVYSIYTTTQAIWSYWVIYAQPRNVFHHIVNPVVYFGNFKESLKADGKLAAIPLPILPKG
jgi:hypothetical protein